jgi:hypothetical protein
MDDKTREEVISKCLETPAGRVKLIESLIGPAQTVLDYWPKERRVWLRRSLIRTMDRLVDKLDGQEPAYDRVRFLSLRSDLKSLGKVLR